MKYNYKIIQNIFSILIQNIFLISLLVFQKFIKENNYNF